MSGGGDVPAERVLHALAAMPADQVVEPGVTAGDARTVMTVPPTPDGCRHDPHRVYGTAGRDGRPLTMHLYSRAPGERRPGVVFVHGGGFQEGFPEMQIRYANHLAAAGYVTAAIRYRLAGEAPWPACLEDAKCAVRWMRGNADAIGLDPDRLAVAGNSAGGAIAALVSTTAGAFEGSGGNHDVTSEVAAAVLWYPVLDLRPSRVRPVVVPVIERLFATPGVSDDVAAAASALLHVDAAPPTLTFTGDADPLIAPDAAVEYHAALTRRGVPNHLDVVAGVGHSFDFALDRWQACFDAMRSFLDARLGAVGAGATD